MTTAAMANGMEEGAPRASTSSLSPSSSFNAGRTALASADDGEYPRLQLEHADL